MPVPKQHALCVPKRKKGGSKETYKYWRSLRLSLHSQMFLEKRTEAEIRIKKKEEDFLQNKRHSKRSKIIKG